MKKKTINTYWVHSNKRDNIDVNMGKSDIAALVMSEVELFKFEEEFEFELE